MTCIVLTTQLYSHSQPDDQFLLKNSQFGWEELHEQAINQGVALNNPIRARTPESHEEYIEDLSWIVSAINFARANKSKLLINYRFANIGQLYDFTHTEPMLKYFPTISEEDILAIDPRPTYIGIYDAFNHLENTSALYYNLNQTFLQHSGRRILTLNVDNFDSTIDLFKTILSVAFNSDDYIWIKSQKGKKYSEKFSIKEIYDYVNNNTYSDKIESFMYVTNPYSKFIVSNYVEMSDEIRFFVVNNQIVEGSPHLPELTPIKTQTPGYHCHLTNHQQPVDKKLVQFAEKMVASIETDDDNLSNTNYSLDVAYDNFGEPIIVELNPLYNSGVYAANPQIIIAKLLENV